MCSQVVLAWVLELVADCVSLQLIEGIGRRTFPSVNGEVSLFADDFFWSPRTLVIRARITNRERLWE